MDKTSKRCVSVLLHGMQLTCAIKGETLLISTLSSIRRSLVENRWDLEEEASDLIRVQQEDDQGWVWLS